VKLLVENPDVRSQTVLTLQGNDKQILEIKKSAAAQNLLLGNGYGGWAKNTFRIANFPAIEDAEYATLQNFFSMHYH
jgi:phosphoserine aminotransferase